MQRYFTNFNLTLYEEYTDIKLDTHHILNVMRMSVYDKFELVDINQNVYIAQIIQISPLKISIIKQLATIDSSVEVTVFTPLLKGDKLDFMFQKSTELGAFNFVIYHAQRSIVKLDQKKREKRLTRFKKIIYEASEQSKRTKIPQVIFKGALKEINFKDYDQVLIADEGLKSNCEYKFRDALRLSSKRIAIIFGPEGGLTKEEVASNEMFTSVQLGNQILRAETAPLYMLSIIDSVYN